MVHFDSSDDAQTNSTDSILKLSLISLDSEVNSLEHSDLHGGSLISDFQTHFLSYLKSFLHDTEYELKQFQFESILVADVVAMKSLSEVIMCLDLVEIVERLAVFEISDFEFQNIEVKRFLSCVFRLFLDTKRPDVDVGHKVFFSKRPVLFSTQFHRALLNCLESYGLQDWLKSKLDRQLFLLDLYEYICSSEYDDVFDIDSELECKKNSVRSEALCWLMRARSRSEMDFELDKSTDRARPLMKSSPDIVLKKSLRPMPRSSKGSSVDVFENASSRLRIEISFSVFCSFFAVSKSGEFICLQVKFELTCCSGSHINFSFLIDDLKKTLRGCPILQPFGVFRSMTELLGDFDERDAEPVASQFLDGNLVKKDIPRLFVENFLHFFFRPFYRESSNYSIPNFLGSFDLNDGPSFLVSLPLLFLSFEQLSINLLWNVLVKHASTSSLHKYVCLCCLLVSLLP